MIVTRRFLREGIINGPCLFRAICFYAASARQDNDCSQEQERMLLCGELLETHPGSPESNGNRIRIVIEFLREYLTVKPQLEVLAQVTNLSKYYLIRRFTQHTGMPPV